MFSLLLKSSSAFKIHQVSIMQESSRNDIFRRMVKSMHVEPEILDALTEHQKAVLFSAIRLEQIERYNKWDADQELMSKNSQTNESENNDKSNGKQSKRHVNYLCGSDGKLIVTTAAAPDYDRTNYSDYGSPRSTDATSKPIVVIREFEPNYNQSESSSPKTTAEKCIFTTNVTLPTTTVTSFVNSNSPTTSSTILSSSTANTIITYKSDKQCSENSIRLIQPNVYQRQFDSSVSESYDSSSCTCDSSSYTNSSATSTMNSSASISSKTTNSSISDPLIIIPNYPSSSLNVDHKSNQSSTDVFLLSPRPFIKIIISINIQNNQTNRTSGHHISIITSSIRDDHSILKKSSDSIIIASPSSQRNNNLPKIQFTSNSYPPHHVHYDIDNNNIIRQEVDEDEITINNDNILHVYNNKLNNTTVIVTASPYNNTSNIDKTIKLYDSSISSNNGSSASSYTDIFHCDLREQTNNYLQINNDDDFSTKISNNFKNNFENKIYEQKNTSTDIRGDYHQDSDVSISDVIPYSPSVKTLKRFILSRSPASSPSITTPAITSPLSMINYSMNEKITSPKLIHPTNSSLSRSRFSRISLLTNNHKIKQQDHDFLTSFCLPTMSPTDEVCRSTTSSLPYSQLATNFSRQNETQQIQQITPFSSYQQQQRTTPSSSYFIQDNSTSKVRQISIDEDDGGTGMLFNGSTSSFYFEKLCISQKFSVCLIKFNVEEHRFSTLTTYHTHLSFIQTIKNM
ncbi:unnamed protein product [Heterobilharzia americana]|nr:unnamed protein product [Heterobilharzia americana]